MYRQCNSNSEYKLEWSKFYTPKGVKLDQSQAAKPAASAATPRNDEEKDDTPAARTQSAPAASTTSDSDDIMAQIRNRISGGQ